MSESAPAASDVTQTQAQTGTVQPALNAAQGVLQHANYRRRFLEAEELLEYAVENGKLKTPGLADELKVLKKIFFYTPPERLEDRLDELCEAEAKLEKVYAALIQIIAPASLETLRATSDEYPVPRPWWSAWFKGGNCTARNFFRQLTWVTIALVSLVIFKDLLDRVYPHMQAQGGGLWGYRLLEILEPLAYGAIGSLIYLYKTLTLLYVDRILSPGKLTTDWLRVFMGALAGLLLVFLFGGTLQDQAAQGGMSLKLGAVALLGGYSVEFFYRVLDRMISAILPGKGDAPAPPPSQLQMQQESLLKMLAEAADEADKAVIRKMLEKL